MEPTFNADERELLRLVSYFKKKAQSLAEEQENKEDFKQLMETCDLLRDHLYTHAGYRDAVLANREQLKSMIKDNARCPDCGKVDMLKLTGVAANEQGWKSNKYRCRSCNIEFVWNAPNNPWDMVPYVENFIQNIESKLNEEGPDDGSRQAVAETVRQMKESLEILKPVVEKSDQDFIEFEAREKEMEGIVNRFKKQLMIEKIRLED
jgi:hypothetical protein